MATRSRVPTVRWPRPRGSRSHAAGPASISASPGSWIKTRPSCDISGFECGLELHADGILLENRPEAGAVVCRLDERNIALGLVAAGKVLVITGDRGDSSG